MLAICGCNGSATPYRDVGVVDAGPSDLGIGPDDAGNYAPTCAITAPLDGTTQDYDDDFVFVVVANDTEDGPLSGASVVVRSNQVVAPLGSGTTVTSLLDPGAHVITCTATDAMGRTGSGSITVTSRSPIARINHPGDGEVRSSASSIPFVGVGSDFEDGALAGSSLVWTSSRDGQFGTGTSFNAFLSAGTHVVTLRVTDSQSNASTATITLTITP